MQQAATPPLLWVNPPQLILCRNVLRHPRCILQPQPPHGPAGDPRAPRRAHPPAVHAGAVQPPRARHPRRLRRRRARGAVHAAPRVPHHHRRLRRRPRRGQQRRVAAVLRGPARARPSRARGSDLRAAGAAAHQVPGHHRRRPLHVCGVAGRRAGGRAAGRLVPRCGGRGVARRGPSWEPKVGETVARRTACLPATW